MKPGKLRWREGASVKDGRKKRRRTWGIDDESSHPRLCSEVADGVTRNIVCLFREPDAGNPPVRFDEREQETEPCQTGLRRRRESAVKSHREITATAPVLDSTPHYAQTHTCVYSLACRSLESALLRLRSGVVTAENALIVVVSVHT